MYQLFTLQNAHQHSIPDCTYNALAISSPGAALDEDLFITLCKHVSNIDRLPLIGR